RRSMSEAAKECVMMVEADAKLLAPVATGTLKRSITHDVKSDDDKTVGAVGSNIEYAYWAEQHTPYLEPAVDQNLEKIKQKIKEILTPTGKE
ncbi:HK97 gp10 family phage protein, partial [bacterium]|nr:HK97 gp10 family phage protein [bacterium]